MIRVEIPVSVGELIDKITILEIKRDRLDDPAKVANVYTELYALMNVLVEIEGHEKITSDIFEKLRGVNEEIWDLEYRIRQVWRDSNPESVVETAHKIHEFNDLRFQYKNDINELMNSELREEKSY